MSLGLVSRENICRPWAYPLPDRNAPSEGKKTVLLQIPWFVKPPELNADTDEQPRLKRFPLDKYVYHRTWSTNGKYN